MQPISIKLVTPHIAEEFQSSLLIAQFDALRRTDINQNFSGDAVHEFLQLMVSLDREHGEDTVLPLADIATAIDNTLLNLAQTIAAHDGNNEPHALHDMIIGIALWAMRHDCQFYAIAPVVNALASRANASVSRQDAAAVFALMQGFIAHLAPHYAADLERSNPERPWRLLNLNFAITAIRSGDEAMMQYAFATLNAHLPDECAGFYQEAQTLAMQPGFPIETRHLIESYGRGIELHRDQLH